MKPCQGYQEKLMLDAYGELDERERFTLEKHLRECEGCRRERERLSLLLERMIESVDRPELSPAESRELTNMIFSKLRRNREKSWWWRWDLTGGRRLIPALAAACLIVVALGWFSLKGLHHSATTRPILGQNGELSLIAEDMEVIENLEFLEEMDILDKLVEKVDDKNLL